MSLQDVARGVVLPDGPLLLRGVQPSMLLLPSYSPASQSDGICHIDRKFHTGACLYAEALATPIVALVPEIGPNDPQMDFIDVPINEMPYRVETIRCDGSYRVDRRDIPRVRGLVCQSKLLYGTGFSTTRFARSFGIPYVSIAEYCLRTKLHIALLSTSSRLRKASRWMKTCARFVSHVAELRHSQSVHCNGYPVYHESRRFNSDCLLYFDSRMHKEMVIRTEAVERRLAGLEAGRRPRLLYSGRFVAMKGATEVIEVGLELLRLGLDCELHLYGSGKQKTEMADRVRRYQAQERITIHDSIPYPELVKVAESSDVFVSCHPQDDPSCTYLEAFGSGLPIVGYSNLMWTELARESEAGIAVPLYDSAASARAVASLLADHGRLRSHTLCARQFALDHCFEREFAKRVERLLPLCN